ncbi:MULTISPECIES: hypothetical protein [unclassified Microbulbifer]|uniref:hypothetical protein n=1 Tax=unclassified Microbulbifer TaxID=2619833 RepID=UPI0027E4F709|nr:MULTISPECIES: hypothetical protein [unclassified Microbulbifer]
MNNSIQSNSLLLCWSFPHRRFGWLRVFMMIVFLLVVTACATPRKNESPDKTQIDSNLADCTTESEPVEKMICKDKELQELHAELQDIHLQLQAIPEARVPIRKSQQSWLRTRNGCRQRHCVELAYSLRIGQLKMMLDICEMENSRMYSSLVRPTEQCQNSLAGLETSGIGGVMPILGPKPQIRKVYGKLSPTRNTVAPARPQSSGFDNKDNSRYSNTKVSRERISSEQDREDVKEVKPGFDCNQKLNYSEMSICSDSYLSSLDNYLNLLYRQYQELSFSPGTLKNKQLKWLKKRNSCKKYDCIEKNYNIRISEIIRGIKNIDNRFSALEPSVVVGFFEKEKKSYSAISIKETIGGIDENKKLFPETFFRLASADIEAFEREKRDMYKFYYSYQVSYKNIFPETLKGQFLVDSLGNLISVNVYKNTNFEKILDGIAKSSMPNSKDHLEIMHSVLIELRSEGVETTGDFLKYFEMEPLKILTGSGKIPCSKHKKRPYLIKGSVLKDIVNCSWGNDIIDTYQGSDEIEGSWGDEIIAAGAGDDIIDGSWGNEMIYAGPGNDSIEGSHGSLTLLYGADWGNDSVSGICDLIIFSSENKSDEILWENKREIVNKRTGDKVKLTSQCKDVHFSSIGFE